jgi:AcrR family transcriptional regulator
MEQEKQDVHVKAGVHDHILLAALKLFIDKGYFNTSLVDIKQAAGLVSLAALYQYFPHKQAIANTLYGNITDSLSISIDDIRRKNSRPSEQLRGIVDLLFKLTDEAPNVMAFLLILRVHEFLPEAKPLLQTSAFVKIDKIIQAGIRAGEIRNIDANLARAYFLGVINHTLCLALTQGLEKKADAYQAQTWLAAWSTIANKR